MADQPQSPVVTAAAALRRWSADLRLVEVALRLYRNWADVVGDKRIDGENYRGVPVREVGAAFREQVLVFAQEPAPVGPHVVTRLSLTILGGSCEVGTCEVVTRPDGVCESMWVVVAAETFGYSDPAGLVAGGGPVRFPRIALPARDEPDAEPDPAAR